MRNSQQAVEAANERIAAAQDDIEQARRAQRLYAKVQTNRLVRNSTTFATTGGSSSAISPRRGLR